jgi:hypothetical protein
VLKFPELMILLDCILKKVMTSEKSSCITYITLILPVGSCINELRFSVAVVLRVSYRNSKRVLLPSIYAKETLLNVTYSLNAWSLTGFERSRVRYDVTVLVHELRLTNPWVLEWPLRILIIIRIFQRWISNCRRILDHDKGRFN